MIQIIIYFFIIVFILAILKEMLPYILGIGAIIFGIYILFNYFDIAISIIIFLVIIGLIYNAYENTIGKRKKIKLREDILRILEKLGMADSKQISSAIIESKEKVEEELKILVSLGMIEAIELTNGDKEGTHVFKFLNNGINTKNTNFKSEEIELD